MVRLGTVVAACALATTLHAQGGQRPPVDTTRTDSSRVVTVQRDSVKPPLPFAPVPGAAGRALRWDRDQIFQTGAANAAELIERIPGAAMLRTGFVLAPQVITWWGEPGRVRVFLDGFELDDLDQRNGLVRDLGAIPVWQLEEIVADATPAELRVHLRSWRVMRTTPETRVDVLTGDDQTNVYRGYYGRRYQSGLGLQFGFEQFTTQNGRVGGDGDALGLFGRLGWARGAWSVDLTTERNRRSRNATARDDEPGAVPALTGIGTTTFLRVAFRSPEGAAPWAQLLASTSAFNEKTPTQSLSSDFGVIPADTTDSTATRAQYVAMAGASVGALRASAAARLRHFAGNDFVSPSVDVTWRRDALGVRARVERTAEDSLVRVDASARFAPLERVELTADVSRRSRFGDSAAVAQLFVQGAVSVTLGRYRVTGGAIRRDSVTAAAPVVFARGIVATTLPAATAEFGELAGPLYKAIRFDVRGTLWSEAGSYHARNDVHARLGLDTDWRSRFPKGDFTIRLFGIFDHTGGSLIPLDDGPRVLVSSNVFSSILEIRIKSATISWQYRNLMGAPYETVPGFSMPARMNLYGVRWYFSN